MIPIRDTLRASRPAFVNWTLIALCALAFVRELSAGPELEAFVTEHALVPARSPRWPRATARSTSRSTRRS